MMMREELYSFLHVFSSLPPLLTVHLQLFSFYKISSPPSLGKTGFKLARTDDKTAVKSADDGADDTAFTCQCLWVTDVGCTVAAR